MIHLHHIDEQFMELNPVCLSVLMCFQRYEMALKFCHPFTALAHY